MAVSTHHTTAYETVDGPRRRANSWGAIIAGAFIALSVQLLLTLLGVAIGLTVLAASPEADTARGVGIGAMIWYIIIGLIALFCGGFVAGRMSGFWRRSAGLLQGAVTWGVATLATLLFLGSVAGTLIGGAWGIVSTAATTTAQATEPVSPRQAPQDLTQEVEDIAEEAPEVVRETAERAAWPSAGVAWGLFLMMLLGLGAAMVGGAAGIRANLEATGDRKP